MSTETVSEIVKVLSTQPDQMRSAIVGPGAFLNQFTDLTANERMALGFSLHGMNIKIDPYHQPEILQARLSAWPTRF